MAFDATIFDASILEAVFKLDHARSTPLSACPRAVQSMRSHGR
ncbi:hypothetical protein AZ78_4351 [Lysobacter capsici AZ78]|uniref:Uncharacterized protein n=1 Tax=Lysobacter capsici AZ78 TaxID=1444315 RepID=A0A108UCR1_9GAMM|nr:hypothetical protein AZ78_4351 [Lysobacter capsici AZ78]